MVLVIFEAAKFGWRGFFGPRCFIMTQGVIPNTTFIHMPLRSKLRKKGLNLQHPLNTKTLELAILTMTVLRAAQGKLL